MPKINTSASSGKTKKEIVQTPKGTRDILPNEMYVWQKVEEKIQAVIEYYGFKPIRTPHFEHTEIFSASLGDATDVVEKQMYTFKTRGGDSLTLRPEGTVPIMRAYLQHGMKSWPQPVMLYYNGSFFRHERPQKGRFREFGQFGIEIVGDGGAVSDAIIIRVLTLALEDLGLKNFTVHINTLGDKECRGAYRKELMQYFRKKVNYLCKDCKVRLKKNPLRILDCDKEECVEIKEGAPQMIEYACSDCKAHFKEVLEFLDELDVPYFLDHYLVRGLDYYSRTVFEIMFEEDQTESEVDKEVDKNEKKKTPRKLALAGGGRYDYLSKALSSKEIPGTGGAIGLDRIVELLKTLNINVGRHRAPKIFLIQLGTYAKRKSLSLMEEFRKSNIPLAQSFSRDSITSQLKIAGKLGVDYALILGQKEAMENAVIVRSMYDGIQETVPIPKLLEYVKKKLKK